MAIQRIPNPTAKSLSGEMKNKVFGTPNVKGAKLVAKKMPKAAVAKRKKTTISNAAGKVMGGLYSK